MTPSEALSPQVEKACRIGRKLRDLKIRQYGIVRIDSAAGAADWAKDPQANTSASPDLRKPHDRRGFWRAPRRRRRDLLGRHAQLAQ
jgi:hypothetical protein